MSRFQEDIKAEQILSHIMNVWVWDRLKDVGNIETYTRETNKDKQLNGTDLWLHTKNKTHISIDEKAQLYYINANLPTFAFELGFLGQNGQVKQGWFVNNSLDTNMYMLIYPFANTEDLSTIEYSSFEKLDCILISKKALWNELIKNGLSYEYLLEETKKMRESGQVGRKYLPNIDWCYLNFSDPDKYTETPINLVIRKEKLLELANQVFVATPQKLLLKKGKEKGYVIESNLFGRRMYKINI